MERRTAIQYSRTELIHKVHEYFPKLDNRKTVETGAALRSYCAGQTEYANYDAFRQTLAAHIPDVPEKKVQGLFNRLFHVEHTRIDLGTNGNGQTRSPAKLTRTKMLTLRSTGRDREA